MKKIVSLLFLFAALIVFSASTSAQVKTGSGNYVKFSLTSTTCVFSATDTLYSFIVLPESKVPVKYDVRTALHKTSGSPVIAVSLQSKNFDSESWSNISTVTWKGKTADTTITFQNVSTLVYKRQFRLLFDGTTATNRSYISECLFKFWEY